MSLGAGIRRVGLLVTTEGGDTRALEIDDPEGIEILRRLFLEPDGSALIVCAKGHNALIDLSDATCGEMAEKALCAGLQAQVLSGSEPVQGADSRASPGAYGAKRAGVDPED